MSAKHNATRGRERTVALSDVQRDVVYGLCAETGTDLRTATDFIVSHWDPQWDGAGLEPTIAYYARRYKLSVDLNKRREICRNELNRAELEARGS